MTLGADGAIKFGGEALTVPARCPGKRDSNGPWCVAWRPTTEVFLRVAVEIGDPSCYAMGRLLRTLRLEQFPNGQGVGNLLCRHVDVPSFDRLHPSPRRQSVWHIEEPGGKGQG